MRALKPDDAGEYDSYLRSSEAAVAKVKTDPSVITNADTIKDVNGRATRLGLPLQCRIGPS